MSTKEQLLRRLDAIGEMLEQKGEALMLIGLGSVGRETARIDDYSDLDFYVVAAPNCKQRFIDQLDWLEDVHPLAYAFKNCDLGYKVMFEDGIYGEYAVFEESELEAAVYSEGRVVWRAPAYHNEALALGTSSIPSVRGSSVDFVVNEALTNLYVGLGRYARGEKLSAAKFIQQYPIDGLLSVMHLLEKEVDYYPDSFGNERRMEKRFPFFASRIGTLIQGYDKVPESALCMLDFLEEVHPINTRLSAENPRTSCEADDEPESSG